MAFEFVVMYTYRCRACAQQWDTFIALAPVNRKEKLFLCPHGDRVAVFLVKDNLP